MTTLKRALSLAACMLAAPAIASAEPAPTFKKQDPKVADVTPLQLVGGIDTVGDAWYVCNATGIPRPDELTNVCKGYNFALAKMAFAFAGAMIDKQGGTMCHDVNMQDVERKMYAAYADTTNHDQNYFIFTMDFLQKELSCSGEKKGKLRVPNKTGKPRPNGFGGMGTENVL